MLNLFCHGPLERGLDMSAGGTDIYNFTLDAAGLATVADSFGAIEQRIVEENVIDWEILAELLRTDFGGKEKERLMLRISRGLVREIPLATSGRIGYLPFSQSW